MKIEEVEGLKELVEKITNRVNGQEEIVQKFKQEIGETRAIASEIKEIIVDKDTIKKIIDSNKTKSDNTSDGSSNNQGGNQGKTVTQVADLAKQMTKEQKAKADEVFKKLKPEDRVLIKSDPERRNEFFKAAMEVAPSIPESLFDDESASTEEDRYGFKKFFGLGNKENNFVPSSRNIGANGFSGANPDKNIPESSSKRLIGGKIPRTAQHIKKE